MCKNCVFRPSVDTVEWVKKASIRAVKTIAQTAVGMIAVGTSINKVDWINVLSVSAVAGILSLLTSIAGIPEVKER